MTIRRRVERWARSKGINIDGDLRTSKYYAAEESRSGRAAWWIEVPERKLDSAATFDVFCETGVEVDNFYHLVVPAAFLKANKHRFHLANNKISLWLSAEDKDFLKDTHPNGSNLDFRRFLARA